MLFPGTIVALLILQSASADAPPGKIERITPKAAAKRTEQCGLGPVTIRYEADLQSHVLTMVDTTDATDAQLACVDQAVSYYIVELPPMIQPRFEAIRQARLQPMILAESKNWLSARGLLDRVPRYVPNVTDDAAFARQIETLCGPRAKGALQSSYGPSAISPDWIKGLGLPAAPADAEAMICLMNVAMVADFKLGFIGNEAFDAPD